MSIEKLKEQLEADDFVGMQICVSRGTLLQAIAEAEQLRAENERLLDIADALTIALENIRDSDQSRMFEGCPDCDHESWCNEFRACKNMAHSKTGQIAVDALQRANQIEGGE